jgi:hypothetical protein
MIATRPYRRSLFGLCAGLLVFFGARWTFRHDKPEKLREIPPNGAELIQIRDDVAYFRINEINRPRLISITAPNGMRSPQMVPALEPFVLHTLPVSGGSLKKIGEHRLPDIAFRRVQVTDNAVYYIAYAEKENRPVGWQVVEPETRHKFGMGVNLSRASLYSIPLAGGAPTEPLPGRRFAVTAQLREGEPVCVMGENIYWIEIEPGKNPRNSCASLKVATRNGGEPKTLLTRLSPMTSLTADKGAEGIVWIVAPNVSELSTARKLYRMKSADDNPQLFLSSQEAKAQLSRPVTSAGRVYWRRDFHPAAASDDQTHPVEILSANLDGSNLRVLYSFTTTSVPSQLTLHADKVYFEDYKSKESNASNYGTILMRLNPDATPAAQTVFRFPAMVSQFFMDGDYLYYTQEEERGQTRPNGAQGSFPIFARVLYRYRLPR